MNSKSNNTGHSLEMLDLEKILEQRAKLDSLLKQKFIKQIVVMFTDLKNSTSLAETKGDLAARLLIKRQNDILFPIIEKNNGKLVKTIGDGTLSYFNNSQNAIYAAMQIQRCINENNSKNKDNTPIYLRIGLHIGSGIVESDDIFGDVVNVAARFVSLAESGEIYLSEDTYNSLENKDEIFCKFIKTTNLKGKRDSFKIFKAYWNEKEKEEEKSRKNLSLVVRKGGRLTQTIPLTQQDILIGRSKQCNIALDEPYISRQHAKVYYENDTYFVIDLQSQMGVILNGNAISNRQELKNGDEIRIGSISIKFLDPSSEEEQTEFPETTTIFTEDAESNRMFFIPGQFKLVVLSNKEESIEYVITHDGLVIGRLKTSNVMLDDKTVSQHHARIWCEEDKVYIEDLGSRNGTLVDGKKIAKMMIKENQEIQICSHRLCVKKSSKKSIQPLLPEIEK